MTMLGGYLATRPEVIPILVITPVATLPHNTPPVLLLLAPATTILHLRMSRHMHTPNHQLHTTIARLSRVLTPMTRDPTQLR